MPRPEPVENQASRLQQLNTFAQDKLGAMGELTGKHAERMQAAIATEENAIVNIIRAKTEGTSRGEAQDPAALETLRYYYTELVGAYYESMSTDTHKLEHTTRPLVQESLQNLETNVALKDVDKNPLKSIGKKALANIEKRLSVKGRISAKVKHFTSSDGAAILAGAATKSPLVGLALWAYNRREKKKSDFANEAGLLEKATKREALPGGTKTATPAWTPELPTFEEMEQNGPIEVGGKLRPPLTIEGDEDWMYPDRQKPKPTATYSGSGGSGGNVNLTPLTAILSRHTEILSAIKQDTSSLVRFATRKSELSSLKEEEAAFESDGKGKKTVGSAVKEKVKNGVGFLGGIIDKLKGLATGFAPVIMGALSAGGAALASALAATGTAFAALAGPALAAGIAAMLGLKLKGELNSQAETYDNLGKAEASIARNERLKRVNDARRKKGLGAFQGSEKELYTDSAFGEGGEKGNTASPTPVAAAPTASVSASAPTDVAVTPNAPASAEIVPNSAPIPSATGLPIDYQAYANEIAKHESGGTKGGGYGAVNQLNYLGKYQMGASALVDAGLVKKGTSNKGLDDPKNWSIEGGKQAFLSNPALQEKVMLAHTTRNYRTLLRIKALSPTSTPQEVAGMLGASHLIGPGGAKKSLSGTDANGMSGAKYHSFAASSQTAPAPSIRLASNSGDAAAPGRAAITKAINTSPATSTTVGNGGGGTMIAVNAPSTNAGAAGRIGYIPSPADHSPIINDVIGKRG